MSARRHRLLFVFVASAVISAALITSAWFVSHDSAVLYHARPLWPLAYILPLAVFLLYWIAGRLAVWALTLSLSLFSGGALANVAALLLWPRGVPDYLSIGQIICNVADLTIFASLLALAGCVLYVALNQPRRGISPDNLA